MCKRKNHIQYISRFTCGAQITPRTDLHLICPAFPAKLAELSELVAVESLNRRNQIQTTNDANDANMFASLVLGK